MYPRDEFRHNKVTGHPAYIEGYYKNQTIPTKKNLGDFIFRGITHRKHPKNRRLITNPNPNDSEPAYIDRKHSRQLVELFEKDEKYKDYKLSDTDKKNLK